MITGAAARRRKEKECKKQLTSSICPSITHSRPSRSSTSYATITFVVRVTSTSTSIFIPVFGVFCSFSVIIRTGIVFRSTSCSILFLLRCNGPFVLKIKVLVRKTEYTIKITRIRNLKRTLFSMSLEIARCSLFSQSCRAKTISSSVLQVTSCI